MSSYFINFILLALFSMNLYADVIFSNIPVATIEVININPQYCNKSCLKDLSKEDKVFSFIARFDNSIDDDELRDIMAFYSSELGIYYRIKFDTLGKAVEVALLMPKKIISKYSTTTIDTILAYLLSRNIDFRFKIFDSIDESDINLNNAINKIKEENFNFVIALLSSSDSISKLENLNIPIYVPTIIGNSNNNNIFFGGINYQAQIMELSKKKNDNNVVIIYNDNSTLGNNLGLLTKNINSDSNIIIEDNITNKTAANFYPTLEKHKRYLENSNLFLNTPVVKSGLLLSQINNSQNIPGKILSTQVNYSPAFLSLIRGLNLNDKIVVANSIGKVDNKLIEYGYLLSSDMVYDWVNYSTALGVDLFLNKMSPSIDRYFSENIEDNRIIYDIKLFTIKDEQFVY